MHVTVVMFSFTRRTHWNGSRGAQTFNPYGAKYHTNTTQLAELASKAKPRLLIIYHASIVLRPGLRPQASSPEELLKEVLSEYSGEVVVARDLDVY